MKTNDLSQLEKFIAMKNGWELPQPKQKVEFWCLYNGNAIIYGKESYRNCKAKMNEFKGVKGLSIKPSK